MRKIDEKAIRGITGSGDLQHFIDYIVELLDRILASPVKLREGLKWSYGRTNDGEPYQLHYIEKIAFYEQGIGTRIERIYIDKLQQFYPDWKGKQFVGDDDAEKGLEELDDIIFTFVKTINDLIGANQNPRLCNLFFCEMTEDGDYWICVVVMNEVLERNLGLIHPVWWQTLKKRSDERYYFR